MIKFKTLRFRQYRIWNRCEWGWEDSMVKRTSLRTLR